MHFLSAGRDDRIQRWIADQNSQSFSASEEWQDSLESATRKEHDALVDMEWELEELERQMACSASAFGRDWRMSRVSVDTLRQSLDTPFKRASQITLRPAMQQADDPQEKPSHPEGSLRSMRSKEAEETTNEDVEKQFMHEKVSRIPFDRRREGRIISQPPTFPSEDFPRTTLSRSRTAPPPITTRISASSIGSRPPITFILQEFSSPLPSAMHFTPTPLDPDTFPTTPRSFTSFLPGQSEPRSSTEQPQAEPVRRSSSLSPSAGQRGQEHLLSPSPTTPASSTGYSEASTPSLSAFPATPATPWPAHSGDGYRFPPPVPVLISKDQPHANKERYSPSSPCPSPHPRDDDNTSVSELSVEGQLSSRFSISSGSRSRSRSRSHSRAGSRAGITTSPVPIPAPPPPTASMRGLMMSVSQQLTRSRSHTTLPRLTIRPGASHAPSASMPTAPPPQSAVEHGGKGWFTPAVPKTSVSPPAPATPKTPSSAMGSLFGMARSASISRKQRLVVKGVKRDESCEENFRRWCENVGTVKHIWRAPGSEDVHVHFRDKDAYKKIGGIETRQIIMPGVGTVALSWVRGSVRR